MLYQVAAWAGSAGWAYSSNLKLDRQASKDYCAAKEDALAILERLRSGNGQELRSIQEQEFRSAAIAAICSISMGEL